MTTRTALCLVAVLMPGSPQGAAGQSARAVSCCAVGSTTFRQQLVSPGAPRRLPEPLQAPPRGRWDAALTGAAVGAVLGYGVGWLAGRNAGTGCDGCVPRPGSYPLVFSVGGGVVGFLVGALIGDPQAEVARQHAKRALCAPLRGGVLPHRRCS